MNSTEFSLSPGPAEPLPIQSFKAISQFLSVAGCVESRVTSMAAISKSMLPDEFVRRMASSYARVRQTPEPLASRSAAHVGLHQRQTTGSAAGPESVKAPIFRRPIVGSSQLRADAPKAVNLPFT